MDALSPGTQCKGCPVGYEEAEEPLMCFQNMQWWKWRLLTVWDEHKLGFQLQKVVIFWLKILPPPEKGAINL